MPGLNSSPTQRFKKSRPNGWPGSKGLVQEGKCKGGHPLRDVGKLVAGKHGHIVIDGPFAESKEAIGGYFHLRVADEAEAVAIAQQCPGLGYGCVVEVRPLAERCTDRMLAFQTGSDDLW